MKMTIALLSVLLLNATARADETPAAEKPTRDDIPALIKQLGDDAPKVREQASQKLRQLGKDALPALKDAEKSDDAEVVARSQATQTLINEDLNPKPKPVTPNNLNGRIRFGGGAIGGVGVAGGNGMQIFVSSSTVTSNGKSVSTTNTNGVTTKETTVTENGNTVKIREDAEGIAVTTTEKKDGKDVSETVKAKDKDALKKDHPEAFKLYEKHAADGGIKMQGGVIRLNAGNAANANAEHERLIKDAEQRVAEARKQAEEQLRRAEEDLKKAREDAAK